MREESGEEWSPLRLEASQKKAQSKAPPSKTEGGPTARRDLFPREPSQGINRGLT